MHVAFIFIWMVGYISVYAQTSDLPGIYRAQSYEKDSTGFYYNHVYHVLQINEDSTFTYSKSQKNNKECNYTYAGFWNNTDTTCTLNFVGEPRWTLYIKEDKSNIILNQPQKFLTFYKAQTKAPEPDEVIPVNKPKKKVKEPKCYTF